MTGNIITTNQKVEKLRSFMAKNKLSAWLINGTDPHCSEYCCEHWRQIKYISGFTGSAGFIVVTKEQALIWTDSRYFIQCEKQIEGTCFEMRKTDGPEASSYIDFLKKALKKNDKVGICDETLMVAEYRRLQKEGINIQPCRDIIREIWKDRPPLPECNIRWMDSDVCGESSVSKIERIREAVKSIGAENTVISSLDDIAWILNLRNSVFDYTPVFFAYLLITSDSVVLFSDKKSFESCNDDNIFKVRDYNRVGMCLSRLKGTTVIDAKKINVRLFKAIKTKVTEHQDFSTEFKAIKNSTEIKNIESAHFYDGVALIKLLASFSAKNEELSELIVADKLEEIKKTNKNYLNPSFATISAFAENGAVVHYSADESTDKKINSDGLLVLDSGSQYSFGTTDVTRTILFGKATEQQRKDYTAVLKGHIALATAVFPEGTTGSQLDVLAHSKVWQSGGNYYHGTGHGVGFCLSVHEGPQRISLRNNAVALKEGMIVSNEPGIYREGLHGVRIENLLLVVKAFENEFGKFLQFKNLTLCPYDLKLINVKMLNSEEIKYVNNYHTEVWNTFKDKLNRKEKAFLKYATKSL